MITRVFWSSYHGTTVSTNGMIREEPVEWLDRHIEVLKAEWEKKAPSRDAPLVFWFACAAAHRGKARVSTPVGAGERIQEWCERHIRAMRELVQSNVPD